MPVEMTLKGMAAILVAAEKELRGQAEAEGVFRYAMIRACVMVQSNAILRLGEYQAAVGPFPKWQQLAAETQAERARLRYAPNDPLLRDGTLARSIEITIKGDTGYVGSNDPVAEFQELGTARIPARPFLGPALFVNEYKIHKLFYNVVFKAMKLSAVVDHAAGDMQWLGRVAEYTYPGG
ncbi:MAG TPA: hypothetical protein VGC15_20005 [Acetobacteraceae bacterium]